jgi:hypothetical protein
LDELSIGVQFDTRYPACIGRRGLHGDTFTERKDGTIRRRGNDNNRLAHGAPPPTAARDCQDGHRSDRQEEHDPPQKRIHFHFN